jgi:RNA polymerase sigma-70 factor (ECF subfamily)
MNRGTVKSLLIHCNHITEFKWFMIDTNSPSQRNVEQKRTNRLGQVAGPTDTELIRRVAQRDRLAFEALYDRYASASLGLAARILDDQAAGEEIVQEAFWRVWKQAGTFDAERGRFSSWLFSIVHHLAIDELRRRRSQPPTISMGGETASRGDLADDAQDVAETAWSNLQSAEVKNALLQLPAAQQTVIWFAYFEGLTHQEIAAKLNEPLGTVHTRARLGLQKLKDALAGLRVSQVEH